MPSEINVCMGWDCPRARLDQYLVHAAFLYASYQQPSEESKLAWSQSRHIGRDGISIINNSARDKMNNLALNSSSTTFYKERNHTRLQWQYKETNICSQVLNNRSSTFYKHGVEPGGESKATVATNRGWRECQRQRGCGAAACLQQTRHAQQERDARKGNGRNATQRGNNDPIQSILKQIQNNITRSADVFPPSAGKVGGRK